MDNNAIPSFFYLFDQIASILNAIKQSGGTSYLVGGCVRDLILGKTLKDFDIEVHSLDLEKLESILKKFGPVKLVGKKFGVLRIAHFDIDWSLPRRDSKGRKPTVIIEPSMTIQDACRRRDLTMNAMAIDLNFVIDQSETIKKKLALPNAEITTIFNIIDPFGGLEDIKHKRLRAVDENLFLEDPLRFFRVMQFIGRFEMLPDKQLDTLCATMDLFDTTTQTPLACERIYEEIKKLFLKSYSPSLGFRWLVKIRRLEEIFPELYALINVPQPPQHHPEGDVFEHTMQSLDAAARLKLYNNQSGLSIEEEKFLIMLAVLCHDLGKPITIDHELHTYKHEIEGVKIAKKLLKRITNNQSLANGVYKLIKFHLLPFNFLAENAGHKAYKRLALKLAPEVTLHQLALVALADIQGRNKAGHEPLNSSYDMYEQFLQKAQEATVAHGPEAPILLGRHLLDILPPGPQLGILLKEAYLIQLEEGIKDVDMLRQRVLKKR